MSDTEQHIRVVRFESSDDDDPGDTPWTTGTCASRPTYDLLSQGISVNMSGASMSGCLPATLFLAKSVKLGYAEGMRSIYIDIPITESTGYESYYIGGGSAVKRDRDIFDILADRDPLPTLTVELLRVEPIIQNNTANGVNVITGTTEETQWWPANTSTPVLIMQGTGSSARTQALTPTSRTATTINFRPYGVQYYPEIYNWYTDTDTRYKFLRSDINPDTEYFQRVADGETEFGIEVTVVSTISIELERKDGSIRMKKKLFNLSGSHLDNDVTNFNYVRFYLTDFQSITDPLTGIDYPITYTINPANVNIRLLSLSVTSGITYDPITNHAEGTGTITINRNFISRFNPEQQYYTGDRMDIYENWDYWGFKETNIPVIWWSDPYAIGGIEDPYNIPDLDGNWYYTKFPWFIAKVPGVYQEERTYNTHHEQNVVYKWMHPATLRGSVGGWRPLYAVPNFAKVVSTIEILKNPANVSASLYLYRSGMDTGPVDMTINIGSTNNVDMRIGRNTNVDEISPIYRQREKLTGDSVWYPNIGTYAGTTWIHILDPSENDSFFFEQATYEIELYDAEILIKPHYLVPNGEQLARYETWTIPSNKRKLQDYLIETSVSRFTSLYYDATDAPLSGVEISISSRPTDGITFLKRVWQFNDCNFLDVGQFWTQCPVYKAYSHDGYYPGFLRYRVYLNDELYYEYKFNFPDTHYYMFYPVWYHEPDDEEVSAGTGDNYMKHITVRPMRFNFKKSGLVRFEIYMCSTSSPSYGQFFGWYDMTLQCLNAGNLKPVLNMARIIYSEDACICGNIIYVEQGKSIKLYIEFSYAVDYVTVALTPLGGPIAKGRKFTFTTDENRVFHPYKIVNIPIPVGSSVVGLKYISVVGRNSCGNSTQAYVTSPTGSNQIVQVCGQTISDSVTLSKHVATIDEIVQVLKTDVNSIIHLIKIRSVDAYHPECKNNPLFTDDGHYEQIIEHFDQFTIPVHGNFTITIISGFNYLMTTEYLFIEYPEPRVPSGLMFYYDTPGQIDVELDMADILADVSTACPCIHHTLEFSLKRVQHARNIGHFSTSEQLIEAFPTSHPMTYATVGSQGDVWIWDVDDAEWREGSIQPDKVTDIMDHVELPQFCDTHGTNNPSWVDMYEDMDNSVRVIKFTITEIGNHEIVYEGWNQRPEPTMLVVPVSLI